MIFFGLAASLVAAAIGSLQPIWTIDGLANPESAYFDEKAQVVYISNVNGGLADKDGNGFITKADLSGKVIKLDWVAGLNAPKGLAACAGKLYVADISEIVVIGIATGKIEAKWPASASMLNDVVIGPDCVGYVSDTLQSSILRFDKSGKVERWAAGEDLQSPNGLALRDGKIYVAAWGWTTDWSTKAPGGLMIVDPKTKIRKGIPGPKGNLDGLESVKQDWLVSDWVQGTVLRSAPNGATSVLIHGLGGAADIEYVAARKMLLVPRMKENKLSAYRID